MILSRVTLSLTLPLTQVIIDLTVMGLRYLHSELMVAVPACHWQPIAHRISVTVRQGGIRPPPIFGGGVQECPIASPTFCDANNRYVTQHKIVCISVLQCELEAENVLAPPAHTKRNTI